MSALVSFRIQEAPNGAWFEPPRACYKQEAPRELMAINFNPMSIALQHLASLRLHGLSIVSLQL